MNKLQYIESLRRAGLLKDGVKLGVISFVLLKQNHLYEEWKKEKSKGLSSANAVIEVSIKERVSESTVWNAIRAMRG